MSFRSLTAIAILINYAACAAPVKRINVSEPLRIQAPPASDPFVTGIQEIDPENPPKEGLWLSWPDAVAMASYLRRSRADNETKIAVIMKERDIATYKLKMAEKQIEESNSPAKHWWLTWGFPIGLGLGVVLGVIIPIVTTQGAGK